MNAAAEKIKANKGLFNKEFQMNYAVLVLDLERLNKDLSEYMSGVQRFCEDYSAAEFRTKMATTETSMNTTASSSTSPADSSSASVSPPSEQQQQKTSEMVSEMKASYLKESARFVSKANRFIRPSAESADQQEKVIFFLYQKIYDLLPLINFCH